MIVHRAPRPETIEQLGVITAATVVAVPVGLGCLAVWLWLVSIEIGAVAAAWRFFVSMLGF